MTGMPEGLQRDRSAMLTVGDLARFLGMLDPTLPIVMAKDSEGNDFSPLACADSHLYVPQTMWSGDVIADGDDSAVPVVVLWPTH